MRLPDARAARRSNWLEGLATSLLLVLAVLLGGIAALAGIPVPLIAAGVAIAALIVVWHVEYLVHSRVGEASFVKLSSGTLIVHLAPNRHVRLHRRLATPAKARAVWKWFWREFGLVMAEIARAVAIAAPETPLAFRRVAVELLSGSEGHAALGERLGAAASWEPYGLRQKLFLCVTYARLHWREPRRVFARWRAAWRQRRMLVLRWDVAALAARAQALARAAETGAWLEAGTAPDRSRHGVVL